jgi:hypothetical protein
MALPVLATAAVLTGGWIALSKYRANQLPANPEKGTTPETMTDGQQTDLAPVAAGGAQGAVMGATFSEAQPAYQAYRVQPEGAMEMANTGVDPSISPSVTTTAAVIGTTHATSADDAVTPPTGISADEAVQLAYGVNQTQMNGLTKRQQSEAIATFGAANGLVW